MKKVLSLVLVIAMVLSSMSFAFASTFEDVADSDYEVAIETMKALGVIDGYPDGTFRPEGVLTRAELAKLLVEALGFGGLAGGASNFSDTKGHWADGHIAIAAGMGLVNGYPDGTFQPEGAVTYTEAFAMVIRALGYTDESLRGVWPTNYMVKALDLELTDGLAVTNGPADRGGVAQVLYNALEVNLVQVDADNKVENVNGDKLLVDKLGKRVEYKVNANMIDKDHKDYKGNVVDMAQYMYQEIVAYENKDGEVVYVKDVTSLTITGTVTAVTTGNITVKDAAGDSYKFDVVTEAAIDFMYNGGEATYKNALIEKDNAEVTVVLEGEAGDRIKAGLDVMAIVATQVSGYIQVEDTYVEDELVLDTMYLPKDGKVVDTDNLVIKGDADSLEDIEENDVLAVFVPLKSEADDYFYTSAASKMTIVVSRNTIEGRVTRVAGENYTIGGKAYKLNAFATGLTLEAGDDGLFYLDHAGKIFAFEVEGSSAPVNYALVLDTTNGFRTASGGGIVLAEPKVKLLTADGEEITYVIDFESAKAAGVINLDGQNIEVDLEKGNLVEYDLNNSKEVDEIKLAVGAEMPGMKTNVNSFNLAKNAVIFNLSGATYVTVGTPTEKNVEKANVEDADVINADDLDTEIDALRVRNTKGEIVVLVVTDGGAEVEGIFALITRDDDNDDKVYDEDTEKDVRLYTAYVDGEKVEYLRHKGASAIEKGKYENAISELTVVGGRLQKSEPVSFTVVTGTAINARVTNSINDTHFLADDVVVYVLKDDGTFDKVGTKNDIRLKNFALYDTDETPDGDYDIVVVWP